MAKVTTVATDQTPQSRPNKGRSRTAAALVGAGAAMLGIVVRTPWLTVDVADELTGGGSVRVRGAAWSAETTAVALVLLVGAIGVFSLRRTGRRVVGGIVAVAALAAAASPAMLLVSGADATRVHTILTAGSGSAQTGQAGAGAHGTTGVPEWSEITNITVNAIGPALALLACVLAFAGGVMVAAFPGGDAPKLNKYEKDAVRRDRIRDDLDVQPDSGRVMWDALDADIDPTDAGQPRGQTRERPN